MFSTTVFSQAPALVTLRHSAQPFHREILKGQKQRAKIASGDFHIVRGEGQTQDFRFVARVMR